MQLLAALALLIAVAVVAYFIRRREGFRGKVLLDAQDLNTFEGPSIRDLLMEKEPAFLERQLDFYNQTRTIYKKIIDTLVGLSGGAREDVVEQLGAQAGGERPDFCSKEQVEELLDSSAEHGLEPLFQCLPSAPARYLLLLSFAAKTYQGQLESAGTVVGLDMPTLPIVEKFSASAAAAAGAAADAAYISPYLLPATASAPAPTPGARDAENQLIAWKAAFDSDSINRIQMYLRYCRQALKRIGELEADAKSGKLGKAAAANVEEKAQEITRAFS